MTYRRCCSPSLSIRRCFPTREERIERLDAYAEGLEAELQGVRERIQELKEGDAA